MGDFVEVSWLGFLYTGILIIVLQSLLKKL